MMMFSFRPRRSSLAPRMAASVSTRVVSWNDAAEMNDWVVRLAFVMPRSSGSGLGGGALRLVLRSAPSPERRLVHRRGLQEAGVAGIGDPDLLQHLADDDADMLVGD